MLRSKHLVLLPGLVCDAALWRHQMEALEGEWEILVGDLTPSDDIGALAEQVLDEAPARFALAGHSLGGYVAQEILRRAPERVERLALVGTNAHSDSEAQRRFRKGLIELAGSGDFPGVVRRLMPLLVHPSRMEDPDVAGVMLEMAERIGPEAFQRQQTAILDRKDGRADLPAIRVPTWVITGREDRLSPPEVQQEMVDLVDGARLVLLEECGHLSPLERPSQVSQAFAKWLG